MSCKQNVVCLLFSFQVLSIFAQTKSSDLTINSLEEVVISDSKFDLPKEKSGKVIAKISAETLQKNIGKSLPELLNTLSSIEINGDQSAGGKNLGYYIRGGKNSQVLILIDGIPVTDASGITMEYDLRLLPLEQIENVEVLKGASSTLYGSGAATAVIAITLKKNNTLKKISGVFYSFLGTNQSIYRNKNLLQDFNQGVSLNGREGKLTYFTSINSLKTGGISQIAPSDVSIFYEKDDFVRLNTLTKLNYQVNNRLNFTFFENYDHINNDYDAPFDNTNTNDTPLNKTSSEQYRFGFTSKNIYQKGAFIFNWSYNKLNRNYHEYNFYSKNIDYSKYISRGVNLDIYNKYEFNELFFLVTGLQCQFYNMESQTPYEIQTRQFAKFNMLDEYFTAVLLLPNGFNFNLGARYDLHSQYGSQWVYNLNPSFEIKKTSLKILSSYSTAFVAPSLYQLYSKYGNKSLTPEKNSTFELGLTTSFLRKKIKSSIVAFYREQRNFIGFDYNLSEYKNINGTYKAKGLETEFIFEFNSKMKLNSNYTFIQTNKALNLLIPKHKVNVSADYQLLQKLNFNITYKYLSNRNDIYFDGFFFTEQNVILKSYQLFDLNSKFQINKKLTTFVNITNIFNENFIENIGYSTRGRNLKLGVQFNF